MSDNQLQNRADSLIARAQAILTEPVPTWDVISKETDPPKSVFTQYAMPLIAIGPIATFLGSLVWMNFAGGLVSAVLAFVFGLVAVWLIALLANALSPQFDGRNDFPAAFRLIAYAMTAAWIAGILNVIPFFGAIMALLASLYSFFLLYKGVTPILGVPQEKAAIYTIVLVVLWFVIALVIGAIVAAITTFFTVMGLLAIV